MPKLPGRTDTRPKIQELTTKLVVDSWQIAWHDWQRPSPCSLEGCDHRPEIGERFAYVLIEAQLNEAVAGRLPYDKMARYVLCENHEQCLSQLWDEHHERRDEELNDAS